MSEWMTYNLKEMFRDKSSLFFIMVFPILLVGILGNMLSELDNPDTPIGTIRIAVYAEEPAQPTGVSPEEHMEAAAETAAVTAFIDALSEHNGVEIVKAKNAADAVGKIGGGMADAAMIFNSPLSIEVGKGGDVYKNRAAQLMAQSFAREYAAYKAAAQHDPEAFMEKMRAPVPGFPGASDMVKDKDLGVSRSMMDYYAVTMIVMIVFMGGGIGGASMMFLMRQDGSLRRVSASSRSRVRLFLEFVVGTLPQNIIQTTIIMVLATVFMGANYTGSWQGDLALFAYFIILGLVVSAVFMLIGLFMKVNPYIPILAVLWALLFISGTFSKEMLIEGFSEYLPMNIIQQAAFDFTVFGRSGQMLLVMGAGLVILCAACVLGSVLFKRKETMF